MLSLILALVSALPTVPGAANPAVTQANIASTICVSGWTKTIRPPASYTNKLKLAQMKALGLTGSPREWEEDHRVPLEVGGNPTDPNNLWPEPWAGEYGAHRKDKLETYVKRKVCSDGMTLEQGRAIFLGDWVAAYIAIFGEPK